MRLVNPNIRAHTHTHPHSLSLSQSDYWNSSGISARDRVERRQSSGKLCGRVGWLGLTLRHIISHQAPPHFPPPGPLRRLESIGAANFKLVRLHLLIVYFSLPVPLLAAWLWIMTVSCDR